MEATIPQVSPRQVSLWGVGSLALMIALVYAVGYDQGVATRVMHNVGSNYLHEFFHDGRHLLGFPCH